ncbi:hypothetical protein EDB81DRAFT_829345 [Dactylonectria macrodidyma]|uniref:Uncharacterized protein n=1 Tax=Dactylonectria macrodidyma TaxID=307937 RepID=A0A9P9I8A5_9HYPO|nr:hypothetical protein EDB81DRAFT_829345 [Dactylonectria macrodidyma]
MAMVQRQPTRTGNQSGGTIRIMSASDFAIEDNDPNRRLFAFLTADLKSSWHPSFKFLTTLIRNIAHSLVAVSPQELADMKVGCFMDGNGSTPRNQTQDWTIRAVADQCRSLCGAAILEMQNGMDIIDRESRELHGTNGPLNRLLREMQSGEACKEDMMGHIQKAQISHDLIVRQQSLTVEKWHDLTCFVSNVRPALNDQLQILESQKAPLQSRRTDLTEDLETIEAEVRALKERESALRADYQDVVNSRDSLLRELRGVKAKCRKLKDEIPVLEHALEELQEDIELSETELQRDEANEKERREGIDKETEAQSLAGSIWSYYWSGATERQRRAQWDQGVGERTQTLGEQKSERNEQKMIIRKWKHELERLELKKGLLEDGRIEADDALADERSRQPEIRQLHEVAEGKRPEVKRLKAELDQVDSKLARIKKYEDVVPNLCQKFGEMEGHVVFTHNGHRHTLRKLNDYTSKFTNIAQRTASWNSKDARDIIEDTLGLRCHYVVIQFMSRACGFVCRELYSDGFLAISHLGTEPSPQDGMSASSPRAIHHRDTERDIDKIYRQGERIARGFDNVKAGNEFGDGRIADKFRDVSEPVQVPSRYLYQPRSWADGKNNQAQNDCFLALRSAINDIVDSTPPRSLWLPTGSRFRHWSGKKRRQAVEDWATMALGQGDDGSYIQELAGNEVSGISELPTDAITSELY